MAKALQGVMAALLTPFDHQQQLDSESLRRLVRFNIGQGIDGLYVGGSTGEAFVQSLAEREQVLEIVAEEAKGKITLIAHVGTVSTAESQQLASAAKRYGFDAVSAVTPFYYPFSFEEHCDHYRAIIDSADGLPMVVYNIPALSGVKLTLDQINTLVTLPGVSALKQTSGDLFQMEQIRRAHPDLVLYNGYDEISPPACWRERTAVSAAHTTLWAGVIRGLCRRYVRAMWRKHSACKPSAIRLLIY
ncbi:N-acetylneuraminate lyase [Salmonella enterica subsp. diarizonae]|uniref:N-acetylneuraminate lyase n=1 Tax=Salmonella diarizonae TaxID=59204 RepID=A0A379TU49_SALDZ|nr:N-acetylneuraminate lyase [Salmonella enterica subsp. diarizonae]